ncbi:MAG: hypothetical protein WCR04_08620, partial [Fibrobacteraceae bacterium]
MNAVKTNLLLLPRCRCRQQNRRVERWLGSPLIPVQKSIQQGIIYITSRIYNGKDQNFITIYPMQDPPRRNYNFSECFNIDILELRRNLAHQGKIFKFQTRRHIRFL